MAHETTIRYPCRRSRRTRTSATPGSARPSAEQLAERQPDAPTLWKAAPVEGLKAVESTLAGVFKLRDFRKRGRNWFRTTSGGQYQVINLQQSSWGGGNCYLNLGWDPELPVTGFRPEHQCRVTVRAEETDVIPPIQILRPDGVTTTEVSGINLLSSEMYLGMSTDRLVDDITTVIAVPVADLLDRTPTIADLVPLFTVKPWLATRLVREHLAPLGYDLPTTW